MPTVIPLRSMLFNLQNQVRSPHNIPSNSDQQFSSFRQFPHPKH